MSATRVLLLENPSFLPSLNPDLVADKHAGAERLRLLSPLLNPVELHMLFVICILCSAVGVVRPYETRIAVAVVHQRGECVRSSVVWHATGQECGRAGILLMLSVGRPC